MARNRYSSLFSFPLLITLATSPIAVVYFASEAVEAQSPTPSPAFPLPASVPNGSIVKVDGSQSMTVVNEFLKQRYEQQYPGTTVNWKASDSATALQALQAGTVDVVAIGRNLTPDETAAGLKPVTIGREKIAIIVGKDNPFQGSLTFEQFARIFRGEITDWSEVGGPPSPIRLIDRPETSDTRQAFQQYPVFRTAPFETGATAVPVADDTAIVIQQLGTDGISYATYGQVKASNDVQLVPMHQTLPTNPQYPYSQPRYYVYKANPGPAIAAFLGLATAPIGQATIAQANEAEAAAIATGNNLATDPAALTAAADKSAADPAIAAAPTAAPDASPTAVPAADGTLGTLSPDAVAALPPGSERTSLWEGLAALLLLPLLGGLLWLWNRNNRAAESPPLTGTATPADPPAVPPIAPTLGSAPEAESSPVVPPIAPTLGSTPEAEASPVVPPIAPTLGSTPEAEASPVVPPIAPTLGSAPEAESLSAPPIAPPLGSAPEAESLSAPPIASSPIPTEAEALPVSPPVPAAEVAPPPTAPPVPPVAPAPVSPPTAPESPTLPSVAADPSIPLPEMQLPSIDPAIAIGAALAAGAGAAALSRQPGETAQSNVEASKFDVGQEAQPTVTGGRGDSRLADVDNGLNPLPAGYGQSHITLLPRDPQWAYAFWDAPDSDKAALRQQGGARLALRFYDVTDVDITAQNPHSLQQYDCEETARDWYLPVPVSDRDYLVEIGYLTPAGVWLMLARSQPIHVPPIYPSDWTEDQFLTVAWDEDLKHKTLAKLDPPTRSVGLHDVMYTMALGDRVDGSVFGSMQAAALPPSGMAGMSGIGMSGVGMSGIGLMSGVGMSGVGMSGIGMSGVGMSSVGLMSGIGMSGIGMSGIGMSASVPPIKPRQFWLVADAELIVYGATEPNATVTIGGRPVHLNPDGTFRFQMSFPDGDMQFPIVATAVDGEQTRSIQLNFNRTTPVRHTNTQAEAVEEWPDWL